MERKNEGLPRSFSQDIFNNINEWFENRSSMQPPHTRDLLSNEDSNYSAPSRQSQGGNDVCDTDADNDDPMQVNQPNLLRDDTAVRASSPSTRASIGAHTTNASFNSLTATPTPVRRNGIPPGVTPLMVSSSDTSSFTVHRQEGNTGIRCKHLLGHNVIADATRTSGEVMAGQMRDMAEANRDQVERSKIEVQLKDLQ